jgi:hypothetical protein
MLGAMDKLEYSDLGDEFIDVTPKQKGRGGRIKWFILGGPPGRDRTREQYKHLYRIVVV